MSYHVAVLGAKGLPAKGGGERVAEAIIQKAIENGFKVTMYGKKDYCGQVNYGREFKLIRLREIRGKHVGAFSFGLLSAMHALMFGKYDVVHLHYADFGFIVPLLRLRFKVLGTSHGAEYNRDKWGKIAKLCFRAFEVPFVKHSNICTCMSRRLADYYSERYKKKVYFVPNGTSVPKDNLCCGVSNRKYNIPQRGYILFAAGRIIPSKGCDLLLMANKKLGLDIPLIIIGSTESDGNYLAHLKSLSMPNVKFVNFIEQKQELFEIISNSRFFVFPSSYEAMSMMLLEVASLKKGIVCSNIPENYDAIGKNAIFFESGNWQDLADKIRFAIDHYSTIEDLAEKGYEYVRRERNWDVITESYIQLYRSLIQGAALNRS